jgi:hypothetical protein
MVLRKGKLILQTQMISSTSAMYFRTQMKEDQKWYPKIIKIRTPKLRVRKKKPISSE